MIILNHTIITEIKKEGVLILQQLDNVRFCKTPLPKEKLVLFNYPK